MGGTPQIAGKRRVSHTRSPSVALPAFSHTSASLSRPRSWSPHLAPFPSHCHGTTKRLSLIHGERRSCRTFILPSSRSPSLQLLASLSPSLGLALPPTPTTGSVSSERHARHPQPSSHIPVLAPLPCRLSSAISSFGLPLHPPFPSFGLHPLPSLGLARSPWPFRRPRPCCQGNIRSPPICFGIDAGLSIVPSLSPLWPLPQSGGWNWVRDRVEDKVIAIRICRDPERTAD
jgi:hypothetical protein